MVNPEEDNTGIVYLRKSRGILYVNLRINEAEKGRLYVIRSKRLFSEALFTIILVNNQGKWLCFA